MASAGVNMPGGDGNHPNHPAAESSSAPEWRLRRRRRLAPPRAAAGSSDDPDAGGPSGGERICPAASPASSSSSSEEEGSMQSLDEEEVEKEEEGELHAPLPPAGMAAPAEAPAAALVWPVAFGTMALIGRMREMEDTVSLHPAFCTWAGGEPMHFFAVFDGHGGSLVSVLCQERMHVILAEELTREAEAFARRRELRQQQAAAGVGTSSSAAGSSSGGAWSEREEEEHAWRAALFRSFRRVDALAAMACLCGRLSRTRCRCPLSGTPSGIVGSTAVVAVLVRDLLVVANCGDSRAVLCRRPDVAVPLSDDHKPDRPDERARIEALGGQVIFNNGYRVRGILAMSRALGDRFLRPEVISEPEITITQRTAEDECLILATDGMWDAITNGTACSVALQCLYDGAEDVAAAADLEDGGAAPAAAAAAVVGPDPEPRCYNAAGLLARLAMGRGSHDNVSVVVVDLRHRG